MTILKEMNTKLTMARDTAPSPKSSPFYVEEVTPENFDFLPELADGQARHHGSKYAGDNETFLNLAMAQNPVFHTLYICDSVTQKPIGYMLCLPIFTTREGSGLYLEDIHISEDYRKTHKGAGSFGMGILMDLVHKMKGDIVEFSVSSNNVPATFEFYRNKCLAERLDETEYDLSNLLSDDSKLFSQKGTFRYDVKSVCSSQDLWRIQRSFEACKKPLDKKTVDSIRGAMKWLHSDVLIASDPETGQIKGLTICNPNFGTVNTSLGIVGQPLLATSNAQEKEDAYLSLLLAARQTAFSRGFDNHFIWVTDNSDAMQSSVLDRIGGFPAGITDGPKNVTLQLHGIKKHVIDSDLPKKLIRGELVGKFAQAVMPSIEHLEPDSFFRNKFFEQPFERKGP